jgi:BlaI family transcriptional regulator, penicillinase repressor
MRPQKQSRPRRGRPPSRQPTASELRILQYLWRHGPSTVRDVHEALADQTETTYTTFLKQLQIMHDKGLVERDTAQRAHVYVAVRGEEQTQQAMLADFMNRVYRGSTAKLVMQALGASQPADPEELAEIERVLREHRKRSN